jgi:hypothetical protein
MRIGALYRFDGARWSRCQTENRDRVPRADPHCPALPALSNFGLNTIVRIPMEYGSDPTKANDFELIASGNYVSGPNHDNTTVVLRYHDGSWAADQQPTAQLGELGGANEIAFSAPNDGWLVSSSCVNYCGTRNMSVLHFDGQQWTGCGAGTVQCADQANLLPIYTTSFGYLTRVGQRIYLYGARVGGATGTSTYPLILFKDPGPCDHAGDSGCWKQAYDPGCASGSGGSCVASDTSKQGSVGSLSVVLGSDGKTYSGWGVGSFGAINAPAFGASTASKTPLIHTTDASGTSWEPTAATGAAAEYLGSGSQIIALPGSNGDGTAVAATPDPYRTHPMVWLNPADRRWEVFPVPFGGPEVMAPDNVGGFWQTSSGPWFYHYSDLAPPDVFGEVAHPVREQMTAASGGGDGSFWVATNSSAVYRYDRLTGWDRMVVPGWDPGRVSTVSSPAYAIAVGPDGSGLVVGKQGRIADVSPAGAVLDAAAGTVCDLNAPVAPCGTGRTLRAAAVAPDGSALVGGDDRALLYRQGSSGSFAAITPPPAAAYASIKGISLPAADRAYLITDTGEIYSGQGAGQSWSWSREDTDSFGDSLLALDERGRRQSLNAIAVDASGHGYIVGNEGTVLERTGSGTPPWQRVQAGYMDDLESLTLGAGGHGALIGAANGLVLTLVNGSGFEPARPADPYAPANAGGSHVVGLALVPGYRSGQVEAWAASQIAGGRGGAILHFRKRSIGAAARR